MTMKMKLLDYTLICLLSGMAPAALAQDTPAELFNLRLGHRCLDVKHRPLLRVGQVELAADAGDPCDASAVAHLQELGQFEHLPL